MAYGLTASVAPRAPSARKQRASVAPRASNLRCELPLLVISLVRAPSARNQPRALHADPSLEPARCKETRFRRPVTNPAYAAVRKSRRTNDDTVWRLFILIFWPPLMTTRSGGALFMTWSESVSRGS